MASSIKNGFTTYSKSGGQSASQVAKNNEYAARQLQYSTGNPTAAQLPSSTINISGHSQGGNASASSGSSGGSGSGSGSSSGSSSSSVDLSALLGGLSGGSSGGGIDYQSRAAERIAALKEAYGASRGTIDAAYNNSLANINNAYAQSAGLLQDNYNSANSALNNSYNHSVGAAQDDAAQSLREAYINKMLQQKNIRQQLSAMGLSGGASESTMANMSNNYGNARNNINTTLNKNISNLAANRDSGLAEILQNYNTNLMGLNQNRSNALVSAEQNRASALASIEQALANGIANAYSDDFSLYGTMMQNAANYGNNVNLANLNMRNDVLKSALSSALKKVADTDILKTVANNTVTNNNATQSTLADISQSTNYTYIEELLKALANG